MLEREFMHCLKPLAPALRFSPQDIGQVAVIFGSLGESDAVVASDVAPALRSYCKVKREFPAYADIRPFLLRERDQRREWGT